MSTAPLIVLGCTMMRKCKPDKLDRKQLKVIYLKSTTIVDNHVVNVDACQKVQMKFKILQPFRSFFPSLICFMSSKYLSRWNCHAGSHFENQVCRKAGARCQLYVHGKRTERVLKHLD